MSAFVRTSLYLSVLLVPAAAVAQTPTEEAEPPVTIEYDKGFTVTSGDGDFQMKTGLRSQTRYELVMVEEAGDETDELQSRFYIPRLRFQLEGYAFGKENTYKAEYEFTGRGNTGLKDFFLDHAFAPGFQIRLGQWKKPFARHELISDYSSDFNERSIANGLVDIGRDLGVMLHNGYDKSPEGLEWALGVFNGQGDADRSRQTLDCDVPTDPTTCVPTAPTNVPADIGPLLVARLGWNMGGIRGYSEGDLEGGPLRLAVGLSYQVDFNDFDKNDEDDYEFEHGAALDALIKVAGADLQGAVYLLKAGDADAEISFFGQVGYFVVPERYQVAARYSYLPVVGSEEDENTQEILGAFNWYFKGHNFKWATDAGAIVRSESDTTDLQLRTMIQFVL